MEKIRVAEYARRVGVSTNSVYKQIKRGVIPSEKVNGLTYVLIDSEEVTAGLESGVAGGVSECERLLNLVETQAKEIKRLTKQLEKSGRRTEKALRDYLAEYQRALPSKPADKEEEIVVKVKKDRKKKKKKRKN